MIAIIGAMEEEVEILKEKMTVEERMKKASMEFFRGTLRGKEVVVVRCGIGKVNAGICTQILADTFLADYIINTGIAGSLQNQIDIGDIVISDTALQHDMDATGFGHQPGEIPGMECSEFSADSRLIELAEKVCREVNPEIQAHIGKVVTGDQFVSDQAVKNRIRDQFSGLCTEMEGAAIAQAAYLNGIPFVILRAISDKADNSAVVDYPEFERLAIQHCVNLVENLVERI